MYLTSKEIFETIETNSNGKFIQAKMKTLVLGILAGSYIALGAHFATTVITGSQEIIGFGLTKLMGGLVFSLGLVLVVIAGAELFTGNTLQIISLWQRKVSLSKLLGSWLFVYLANFVGAMIVVALIYYSGLNQTGGNPTVVGKTAISLAAMKTSLPLLQIFIRGILANWLVCLAIVLCTASKDVTGKILGVVFPITAFVAMGCEHSVANMYFIPAGMLLSHSISISGLLGNLLASTLGNIVGATLFVWTTYWFVHLKQTGK